MYTLHVELCSAGRVDIVRRVSLVESNDLWAKEVGTCSKVWEGDTMLAFVGNKGCDGPGLCCGVIPRFGELDPDVASAVGRCGCNIDKDRAFVRLEYVSSWYAYGCINGRTGSMISSEASTVL